MIQEPRHGSTEDVTRPMVSTREDRAPTPAHGETSDGNGEAKGGFLSELSIPQVLAGALAAVTSMLLSSEIGIAGSVIGVAVGSVVSAVSSAVYKHILASSADRIRQTIQTNQEVAEAPHGSGHSPAADMTAQASPSVTSPGAELDGTRVMASPQGDATTVMGRTAPEGTRGAEGQGETPLVTPELHRRMVERQRKVNARMIAVAVITSLVAVALSAVVVLLLTGGNGLGQRTVPFTTRVVESESTDGGDHTDATAGDQRSATDGSQTTDGQPSSQDGTTDSGSSSSTNDGTTTGTTDGTENGSTASSTSTDQGSQAATPSSSSTSTGDGTTGSSSGDDDGSGSQGTSAQSDPTGAPTGLSDSTPTTGSAATTG